jgi:hypothetical protein
VEPYEEVPQAEIERIGLTGVQAERSGDCLERCTVAEVEAGKERSVVAQERDDRDARGG